MVFVLEQTTELGSKVDGFDRGLFILFFFFAVIYAWWQNEKMKMWAKAGKWIRKLGRRQPLALDLWAK